LCFVFVLAGGAAIHGENPMDSAAWKLIEPLFQVPAAYQNDFGQYRSPLLFEDGSRVETAAEWPRRRREILAGWNSLMGAWPPVLEHPGFEVLKSERRENFEQRRVRVEVAAGQFTEGWVLVPDGPGPFPAVFVPFYEPETSIGLGGKPGRDFARQLTRHGFVTLSIGTPAGDAWKPDRGSVTCQPLSYYAYVAANCWQALAALPEVDAKRIGVVGHSYGGKWSMFAGALWDKFAAVATSDPGIVFDETRPNVNYWEPWYLGYDPNQQRPRAGLPTKDNPRTGPYKKMIETGHDLQEIHALIAPRPFFVSGGAEDRPERWVALNHLVAVDQLLGASNRVGLSSRPHHDPTPESNAQLVAFFEHFLKPDNRKGNEAGAQSDVAPSPRPSPPVGAREKGEQRLAANHLSPQGAAADYFPPPESKGGWRKLDAPDDIRRTGGMDPDKLAKLAEWLRQSDDRTFAADVIRHGYIVLEVERGNSAITDSRRVASCSKAVCATVLAIASERSQHGLTPRRMTFDDPAFDFIPWAKPLSDPRKAQITVQQLLNHTSGICPEATGAPNDGSWEYILGLSGDPRTAKLAFDPGTGCGYSTLALAHAALVCENVTGKPYDQFAIEALFKPIGIEHWWFQYYDGGPKIGRHPSHGLGMPSRDLARIAYCMLHNGRWGEEQVIPEWFVAQTGQSTHNVRTPEMRWKLNPQVFSSGWERPSFHQGEDGRSGKGIPGDAREKPGSGGQLIAFVPSLDLVVTRQTGSSGDWAFEEYLRRACAAVIQP
jgi:CubicO group peptidase (beta-lactamase class C family)/dienelactone hydrolase